MYRFLLLTFAAVLFAATPLSKHDREFGMSQLHGTRKMFLDAVAPVTAAQWNFKPAPDRWSVAEIAEHIAVSEDMFYSMITEKVLKTPADPQKKAAPPVSDDKILVAIVDRSRKAKAPESLVPTHRWKDKDELLAAFLKSRDRNIAFLETTQDDLREHFAQGPAGDIDAYQWLLLMSAHTERHLKQMDEVKADPNYPKP